MTDTTALPAQVAAPASTPIADYGLLADCNSAALVDRAGSIDWLCLPRYDSSATFTTDAGTVRLLDAMAAADGQRGHDLGFDAPHEVLRSVEGVEGEVEMVLELAPRPEYGLIRPLIRLEADGARTFGSGRLAVRSAVPLAVEDATMRASFAIAEGERRGFSLRWAAPESRE